MESYLQDDVTSDMIVTLLERIPEGRVLDQRISKRARLLSEHTNKHENSDWIPRNNISPVEKGTGISISNLPRRHPGDTWNGENARAFKFPLDKDFVVGLDKPLTEYVRRDLLDPICTQKLIDATEILQKKNKHILEPLTLYSDKELYELMASIAESWKNCGKMYWKKKIHKIHSNAKQRQPPKNVLRPKEIATIKELEQKIRLREEWEMEAKERMLIKKN